MKSRLDQLVAFPSRGHSCPAIADTCCEILVQKAITEVEAVSSVCMTSTLFLAGDEVYCPRFVSKVIYRR